MTQKRIALDVDGVCYNYSATACHMLNTHFGYKLDWKQTNSWDWLKENVSNKAWTWLWSHGLRNGLFRYGHLIKGAAEGVKALGELGKIVVVTSRPQEAVQDTLDWLAFMKFPVSEVHILGHGMNKAEIRPDVAIDDGPHNIRDYVTAKIPVVAFHAPYNAKVIEELADTNLVSTAFNWPEVVQFTEDWFDAD